MSCEARCVSVVLPVYNSATTLRRAVASAVDQTLRDLEVLIVDDGSRDDSHALARDLAASDPRIAVIALPENRGKSFAMNRAIETATGRWIAVLDADDWYEPERLRVLVTVGEARDVLMVADNQTLHDAGAGQAIRTALPIEGGDKPLNRSTFAAASDPYAEFDYGMLKPVVRADFIRRKHLIYRENARLSEDFLYLTEFFAAGGTGILVSRPLYNWTQSFGEISRQWTTTGAGAWRYDFGTAIEAIEDVSRELRDRGECELTELLSDRVKAFKHLHHLNEINRHRALGMPIPHLLGMIARHPAIWPHLARRAFHAIWRPRGVGDRMTFDPSA